MPLEKPIEAKREGNTATLIYDRLRSDILSGKLAPGRPLSQLTIARDHGTSRGPVREAMRQLQQDQLVIGLANRRFTVAPFEIDDLEAVLSLHLANVALAIRASVPLLSDADLVMLENWRERMDAAVFSDVAQWETAYRSFVLTITRHAGERTVALLGDLIDNIQRYRTNLLDRFPRVYTGGPEFRRVVAAARARDGVSASNEYSQFFGEVSSLILTGAAPLHDAVRLRTYLTAIVPMSP